MSKVYLTNGKILYADECSIIKISVLYIVKFKYSEIPIIPINLFVCLLSSETRQVDS